MKEFTDTDCDYDSEFVLISETFDNSTNQATSDKIKDPTKSYEKLSDIPKTSTRQENDSLLLNKSERKVLKEQRENIQKKIVLEYRKVLELMEEETKITGLMPDDYTEIKEAYEAAMLEESKFTECSKPSILKNTLQCNSVKADTKNGYNYFLTKLMQTISNQSNHISRTNSDMNWSTGDKFEKLIFNANTTTVSHDVLEQVEANKYSCIEVKPRKINYSRLSYRSLLPMRVRTGSSKLCKMENKTIHGPEHFLNLVYGKKLENKIILKSVKSESSLKNYLTIKDAQLSRLDKKISVHKPLADFTKNVPYSIKADKNNLQNNENHIHQINKEIYKSRKTINSACADSGDYETDEPASRTQ